jgi:hypothetical protein
MGICGVAVATCRSMTSRASTDIGNLPRAAHYALTAAGL